jgi:dTDP-4-amino-4,6-dideoxygalactose transaminase
VISANDFQRQWADTEPDLTRAFQRVMASGWYILGAECAGFESEFAAYCGTTHCITVANGTDALELALRTLGIQPGDCQ